VIKGENRVVTNKKIADKSDERYIEISASEVN
jgi:hypothetical protein